MYSLIQLEYLNKSVEEGIQGVPASTSASDESSVSDEILLEVQEIKNIMVENIDIAKDFVSVGFGVLLGVIVGYIILKFLGR